MTAPQPARDGEVCACGHDETDHGVTAVGCIHCPCSTPCPAAPSEPPAADSPTPGACGCDGGSYEPNERPPLRIRAGCPWHAAPSPVDTPEPPAETQQDDEPAWVEPFYRWAKADKSPGSYSAAFAAGWAAARPSADAETLRRVAELERLLLVERDARDRDQAALQRIRELADEYDRNGYHQRARKIRAALDAR